MREFRIIKNEYWDLGKIVSTKYSIEERMKLLSFTYWKTIVKTNYSWSHEYKEVVQFNTIEETEEFISSLLEDNPVNGWVKTEIKLIKENEKV
jgi:hypothetical protein